MNNAARFAILFGCFVLCAGGIINSWRTHVKTNYDYVQSSGMNPAGDYLFAASDASLKLSLNEIERIIRRDPVMKSPPGRMEFGSVKMERGAVVAQVLYLETDGCVHALVYKLRHENRTWKVSSAERLWFAPRSHLLRGLRV